MKKQYAIFGLLLSLCFGLFLLSGCAVKEETCTSSFTQGQSFENVCGLGVEAGAKTVEVRMQVKLSQGEMKWSLEDPQGIIRWQGHTEPGDPTEHQTRISRPLPGRWNLKIKLEGAVGEYAVPWNVY